MLSNVEFRWPAEAALRSLDPAEQDRVRAAVDRIGGGRFRNAPEVYQLKMDSDQVFVLRVDEVLRVLFTVGGDDGITVKDIINRRFAQQYG